MAAIYQPLKRLATIVTPRWGFVLQLVLRRVDATKVRASIIAKHELKSILERFTTLSQGGRGGPNPPTPSPSSPDSYATGR